MECHRAGLLCPNATPRRSVRHHTDILAHFLRHGAANLRHRVAPSAPQRGHLDLSSGDDGPRRRRPGRSRMARPATGTAPTMPAVGAALFSARRPKLMIPTRERSAQATSAPPESPGGVVMSVRMPPAVAAGQPAAQGRLDDAGKDAGAPAHHIAQRQHALARPHRRRAQRERHAGRPAPRSGAAPDPGQGGATRSRRLGGCFAGHDQNLGGTLSTWSAVAIRPSSEMTTPELPRRREDRGERASMRPSSPRGPIGAPDLAVVLGEARPRRQARRRARDRGEQTARVPRS